MIPLPRIPVKYGDWHTQTCLPLQPFFFYGSILDFSVPAKYQTHLQAPGLSKPGFPYKHDNAKKIAANWEQDLLPLHILQSIE